MQSFCGEIEWNKFYCYSFIKDDLSQALHETRHILYGSSTKVLYLHPVTKDVYLRVISIFVANDIFP